MPGGVRPLPGGLCPLPSAPGGGAAAPDAGLSGNPTVRSLFKNGNEIRRCRGGWRLHDSEPITSMAALAALGPGRLRRHADAACRLRLVPGALGRLSLQLEALCTARPGWNGIANGCQWPMGPMVREAKAARALACSRSCTLHNLPVLGHAFELLVSWHTLIVIWEAPGPGAVLCHVDLFESS